MDDKLRDDKGTNEDPGEPDVVPATQTGSELPRVPEEAAGVRADEQPAYGVEGAPHANWAAPHEGAPPASWAAPHEGVSRASWAAPHEGAQDVQGGPSHWGPEHAAPGQGGNVVGDAPLAPVATSGEVAPAPGSGDADTEKRKIPLGYVAKRTIKSFMANYMTDSAAALTYYAVLALAPTLLALVAILGVVGNGERIVQNVLDEGKDLIAPETYDTINGLLTQVADAPAAGPALIIGVLIALWSASSYVTAFSRASNKVFGVLEGRPIWKLRPMMYLVTLTLILLAALAAVMVAASGPVARVIGEAIGLSDEVVTLWNIAKWPLVVVIALIAISLLYRRTPNVKRRRARILTWGAGVSIVVWGVASFGFAFYVSNFGNYDKTYGALGAVVVFLLWIWISNLALLFGAQLDAELERGRQLRDGLIAEEEIQLPRRDTKASDKKAVKARQDIEQGREIRQGQID